MDMEGKPIKDLANELESLREEIAHLQSLIQNPIPESPREETARPEMPGLPENGPFGMALVDSQCRILNANRAFCRMMGYGEQEIVALRLQDLAQDPAFCAGLVPQVLDAVVPSVKVEQLFNKKSGESFWVQVTASAAPEGHGKSCVIILEDISARKWAEVEIETEKQLLERLINSSVDGILAFDREAFFTVWNPGMEKIFGVSARETLGRSAF